MDVPDPVRERLGDERATTRVNVGGDDWVYVTPARTLVYRTGGFLRSQSIREFSHDAQALDVTAGRRQATFALTYAEDVRGFTVPEARVETLLTPVLSGVLATTGVIETGESVLETYCFTDRTVVVTDARVLVHGGESLWSSAYREHAYPEVTEVRFEQGASTPVVLVTNEGRHRIETPAEQARAVHRTIERAVAAAHDDGATGGWGSEGGVRSTTGETETEARTDATQTPESGGEPPVDETHTQPGGSASATDTGRSDGNETDAGPTTRPPPNTEHTPETTGDADTTAPPPPAERAGRTDGAGDPTEPATRSGSQPPEDAPATAPSPDDAQSRPSATSPAETGSAETPPATTPEDSERENTSGESHDQPATPPLGDGDDASKEGLPDRIARSEGAADEPPTHRPAADFDRDALVAELDALSETVSHQRDLLERQHDRIKRLSEALDTE